MIGHENQPAVKAAKASLASGERGYLALQTFSRAVELISPDLRNNPALYPPPEVMLRLWTSKDLGEANKLYDELWTQIKSN